MRKRLTPLIRTAFREASAATATLMPAMTSVIAVSTSRRSAPRVGHQLQGDVVLSRPLGVERDPELLDSAALTGDVDHAWNGPELSFKWPFLNCFDLIQLVTIALQHVTHDFTRRAPTR